MSRLRQLLADYLAVRSCARHKLERTANLLERLVLDLARRLEPEYPSAAESVREGLDETLTVLTPKLSPLAG